MHGNSPSGAYDASLMVSRRAAVFSLAAWSLPSSFSTFF
jgi:hypothetical protein